MRLNQFIARATGLSRRAADEAIQQGRVTLNGQPAAPGIPLLETSQVRLDGELLKLKDITTVLLNKPGGYVCSRDGQGSQTVYDLLPAKYHHLKPVGRLDKDSSGLLLMTSDGELANQLTHPRYAKTKVYEVELERPLKPLDQQAIEQGITLKDGLSALKLQGKGVKWTVTMHEGRNRQIRRTFGALDYTVMKLHRTQFGDYQLGTTNPGKYQVL